MTALRVQRSKAVARGEVPAGRADFDPAEGPWSHLEMLVATLIDEVRFTQHTYISSKVPRGQRPKPPPRVPRPGVKRERPGLTMAQRMRLDPRLRQRGATPRGRQEPPERPGQPRQPTRAIITPLGDVRRPGRRG